MQQLQKKMLSLSQAMEKLFIHFLNQARRHPQSTNTNKEFRSRALKEDILSVATTTRRDTSNVFFGYFTRFPYSQHFCFVAFQRKHQRLPQTLTWSR